ncbi:unnamed protein product [Bursaphelenchus okinawaensis]|uniref:Serpentine receptor class gamma n=1 Tax=Bursaphelenchus okinawaensis TaxID=465554 RepID=A0A811K3R8_9BILA|nr:unnamed protein product [Bursaphelenchus okinawaensis]CAG9090025.1 unnamed protein product [Bursaphelenchus okinawaensis]
MYIMVIWILFIERKRFPSVFYKLVSIFGIQEVICYLLNQYVQRWPTSQFVYESYFRHLHAPSRFQILFYFFYFYTQLQGVLAATILAFNRVSCVLFPVNHDTVWRKHLKYVLILYYLSPLLCFWTLPFNKALIECSKDTGDDRECYFTYDHSHTFGISVGNNNHMAFITLSVISCIFNLVTIAVLTIRKKSLKVRRGYKQEINLFMTSFILFLTHLAYGIVEVSCLVLSWS